MIIRRSLLLIVSIVAGFGLSAITINRADIHEVAPHRRAVVVEISSGADTTFMLKSAIAISENATRQHLLNVPTAPARNPETHLDEHTATPVVFMNNTDGDLLIQQQPPSENRLAACADKLNARPILALCSALGGGAGAPPSNGPTPPSAAPSGKGACSELEALVTNCKDDPTFDVATTDTLVAARTSFEVHVTDKALDYVIREKPDDKAVNKPPAFAPISLHLNPVDGLPPESEIALRAAVVPLDNSGVASWRYANPLNPACIRCASPKDASALSKTAVDVAFENRTVDRTFIVSLQVPKDIAKNVAARGLAQCKPSKPCAVPVVIGPQSAGVFDAALINALPPEQLLQFSVSFFDETEKVANPTAYLSLLPAFAPTQKGKMPPTSAALVAELDSATAFDVTSKASTNAEPDLGKPVSQSDKSFASQICRLAGDPTAPSICSAAPYVGKHRHHYGALARLDLKQNLGSRADASATLGLRSSDLGGKDTGNLTLSQYLINIYSPLDFGFQVGRTTFLDAANKIALSEKGDGYRWIARVPNTQMTTSLTHILKRESETGTADPRNRDNHEWLVQVRGIHFPRGDADDEQGTGRPRWFGLRTADVLLLIGNEKATVAGVDGATAAITPYTYRTFGGEAFYAFANLGCQDVADGCGAGDPHAGHNWGNIAGSIAAFRSERRVAVSSTDCATALCDGRGTVGLFTITWTPQIHRSEDQLTFTAKRSLSLLLGAGSGDRASKARDEGYVGETAAFAPDVLFLSGLQPATDTTQRHPIGPSLSNKIYTGIQYTENSFSPIVWLSEHIFRLDPALVLSRSTILRVHDYRFRQPVNGSKQAAREVDLDFQTESPKGINVTMGAARLWPGAATRPLVSKQMWLLTMNVSLKL